MTSLYVKHCTSSFFFIIDILCIAVCFFTAVGFGIDNMVFAVEGIHHYHQKDEYSVTAGQKRIYTFLLLEVILHLL